MMVKMLALTRRMHSTVCRPCLFFLFLSLSFFLSLLLSFTFSLNALLPQIILLTLFSIFLTLFFFFYSLTFFLNFLLPLCPYSVFSLSLFLSFFLSFFLFLIFIPLFICNLSISSLIVNSPLLSSSLSSTSTFDLILTPPLYLSFFFLLFPLSFSTPSSLYLPTFHSC